MVSMEVGILAVSAMKTVKTPYGHKYCQDLLNYMDILHYIPGILKIGNTLCRIEVNKTN